MAAPLLLASETAGREVFLGFPGWGIALFYAATTVAIGIFLWGFFKRIRKYTKGRPVSRIDLKRFLHALGDLASNRTIAKRKRSVGIAHFFVFWGFIILLIGTTIIVIDEDIIGVVLQQPQLQFWHGSVLCGVRLHP